jgi:hypothetical protein
MMFKKYREAFWDAYHFLKAYRGSAEDTRHAVIQFASELTGELDCQRNLIEQLEAQIKENTRVLKTLKPRSK